MKNIIITIILSTFFILINAQETILENPQRFLSVISQLSKKTTSIEADFVQEKKVSYLKDVAISSGKFYSQNGNMRWEQTKPHSYIMMVSEQGVQIKDDGKEKNYGAMANKFMEQIQGIMMSSMSGNFTENKDFSPTYFQNSKEYVVKLTPVNRRLSKMFKGIYLSFYKTTFRLKTLTFVQEDGESKMIFSNEKFNSNLSSELFTKF